MLESSVPRASSDVNVEEEELKLLAPSSLSENTEVSWRLNFDNFRRSDPAESDSREKPTHVMHDCLGILVLGLFFLRNN